MSDTKLLAKDLRIGNLVYGPLNELCVVDQIGRYDNPEYVAYHELNNLVSGGQNGQRPIPLSEDVLVKLGFEKNGIRFSKDWFYLWLKDGEILFALEEMQEGIGSYLAINYIHSLQNLYYSLTNQELIYTP